MSLAFMLKDLEEIDEIAVKIQQVVGPCAITSWLYPEKLVTDIELKDMNTSDNDELYLGLTIDRLYLILNLILKLLDRNGPDDSVLHLPRNIHKKPQGLSFASLIMFIWRRIEGLIESKKLKHLNKNHNQIKNNNQQPKCTSCCTAAMKLVYQMIPDIENVMAHIGIESQVAQERHIIEKSLFIMKQDVVMTKWTNAIVADMKMIITFALLKCIEISNFKTYMKDKNKSNQTKITGLHMKLNYSKNVIEDLSKAQNTYGNIIKKIFTLCKITLQEASAQIAQTHNSIIILDKTLAILENKSKLSYEHNLELENKIKMIELERKHSDANVNISDIIIKKIANKLELVQNLNDEEKSNFLQIKLFIKNVVKQTTILESIKFDESKNHVYGMDELVNAIEEYKNHLLPETISFGTNTNETQLALPETKEEETQTTVDTVDLKLKNENIYLRQQIEELESNILNVRLESDEKLEESKRKLENSDKKVQDLEVSLKQTNERLQLLLICPDGNNVVLSAKKNPIIDMENQIAANIARIEILQNQNAHLNKTITKMKKILFVNTK